MSTREIRQIINGNQVSDGAGVQLTRIIGSPQLNILDPFLLFDAFGSEQPQDYLPGFPPHPHRGFETVTYMLEGKMRHEDSAGHAGTIQTGGVQWMTAGRGIIHSEMPQQEHGLLAGLQLWVNLPATEKMTDPQYQEFDAAQIPVEQNNDGVKVKVIAGKTNAGTTGVIHNQFVDPIYLHVSLTANSHFEQSVSDGYNAFLYVLAGAVTVGTTQKILKAHQLAVLDTAGDIKVNADMPSEVLLIAGKPLNEPVARGGPFVMNTREQVEQAFADYKNGLLG